MEKQTLLLKSNESRKELSTEQIIATILVMLPAIPSGMTVAFSAIALPQLNLNLIQTSWFASLPTLAAIFGNLSSGFLIDRYGRRNTFFLNSGALIIGCIFLSGSPTIANLYIGQIFCGISIGAAVVAPTVYITESIVPDNLHTRNSLASWNILSLTLGVGLDFVASLFFVYQHVVLLCAALSLIFITIFLIFIPESPAWLYQTKRYEEANLARKKLSFGKEILNYEDEKYMHNYIDHKDIFTYIKNITRCDVYKPLFICLIFFFFQQFSGSQVYVAFMVDLIKPTFLPVSPYQLSAVSGFIPIAGVLIYSFISPHTKLRKLGMVTSFISGIMTFLIGFSLYLNESWHSYSYIVDYIHILAVWLNLLVTSMGIGTIPYTILAEIFPEDVRGFASIPVLGLSLFYYIILMLYPFASEYLIYGIHYIFSGVNFLSILFIYWFVPETIGKKLHEITSEFL